MRLVELGGLIRCTLSDSDSPPPGKPVEGVGNKGVRGEERGKEEREREREREREKERWMGFAADLYLLAVCASLLQSWEGGGGSRSGGLGVGVGGGVGRRKEYEALRMCVGECRESEREREGERWRGRARVVGQRGGSSGIGDREAREGGGCPPRSEGGDLAASQLSDSMPVEETGAGGGGQGGGADSGGEKIIWGRGREVAEETYCYIYMSS